MSISLVIGASGMVGSQLVRSITASGAHVIGTYRQKSVPGLRKLDIRQADEVNRLIQEISPNFVYLPAAAANVDAVQIDPRPGYETNVIGVYNVIAASRRINAKIVYFSTDCVFNGENGPYSEIDPPDPISAYGTQKLLAEHAIALHALDGLILRTTVVYGIDSQQKNFYYRLMGSLQNNQPIQVPIDQIGNPTYCPSLAMAAITLANQGANGIFHVVGNELANRYEFACEIATVFNLDGSLIQPVKTEELGQAAHRPLIAGLLNEKAQKLLPFELLGYHKGLKEFYLEITPKSSYR